MVEINEIYENEINTNLFFDFLQAYDMSTLCLVHIYDFEGTNFQYDNELFPSNTMVPSESSNKVDPGLA